MPIRKIPGTSVDYYLVAFDRDGRERTDDPDGSGGLLSAKVLAAVASASDVFFFSHGWMGDLPAAIDQYDRWMAAFWGVTADRQRAEASAGFEPCFIGLHWPSLPIGNESFGAGGFAVGDVGTTRAALIDRAALELGDTGAVREALGVLFDAHEDDAAPEFLSPELVAAYATLAKEAGITAGSPASPPGEDGAGFEPASVYAELQDDAEADFGNGGALLSGLLAPIRLLSFWKMKKRARTFGESGGAALLRAIQQTSSARTHLMGHSFGCIVTCGCIQGTSPLTRPVDTVYLVQGALSLWTFSGTLPGDANAQGYFHRIAKDGLVRGAIVTTQSQKDTAVRKTYPLAAGVAGQVDFAMGLPKFGGVGTWGLQGAGFTLHASAMLPIDQAYGFAAGQIYNLKSDTFITKGGPPSGAHSDIDGAEVAHAFWEAARV